MLQRVAPAVTLNSRRFFYKSINISSVPQLEILSELTGLNKKTTNFILLNFQHMLLKLFQLSNISIIESGGSGL